MAADTVIRGGTVIDGTGAPGRLADVAVTQGRISAIGEGLTGDRVLDAGGCIVAPGFIDIHTHYDAQVFWDPALTPSCFHGVTTVVGGNCGFSIAPTLPEHRDTIAATLQKVEDMDIATLAAGIPWDFQTFPEYLASIERRGTVLNYNAYIGHTALRFFVLGIEGSRRAATSEEIERMSEIVREAMRAGAVGFATTFAGTHVGADGRPVASRNANREEFEALCHAVGEMGRGVVGVTPGEHLDLAELYELQPKVGRPFTYTALLTFPGVDYRAQVELNDKGRARGADVWPQVSPRPLTFQMTMTDPFMFNVTDSFRELMAGTKAERLQAYSDPAWRNRAKADLGAGIIPPRWETYRIAESEMHRDLIGQPVSDLAAQRGVDPLDLVLELAVAEDLATRFGCVIANDDVEGVAFLLQQDGVVLGLSDAGAHVGQLCDAPQATDLLGNWVRDRDLMPIEKAVRKLTGEPADIFGFSGRGYLREGACADIAVFDPDTVGPGPVRRVRDFPADGERLTADAPTGMNHVLVNGTPIRVAGESLHDKLDSLPGQIARVE
ncbi:MAG: amidohydrolase family protein [Deltaproteobacteria bacterium]|nr:amidohydrolase family protein [Deltaproteobacteria bacterium]